METKEQLKKEKRPSIRLKKPRTEAALALSKTQSRMRNAGDTSQATSKEYSGADQDCLNPLLPCNIPLLSSGRSPASFLSRVSQLSRTQLLVIGYLLFCVYYLSLAVFSIFRSTYLQGSVEGDTCMSVYLPCRLFTNNYFQLPHRATYHNFRPCNAFLGTISQRS